jgi:hypothetical protein
VTIDNDIEALAAHIATEAMKTGDGAPRFGDKVDALKTLAAYYAMRLKQREKPEDAEPDDFDFSRGVEDMNGRASVRGGRGE